ncbi:MAG: shikimate kinase [Micrococcales bacterium]|nr:shikimate kinase [Micrococcales bacterium]
MVTNRVNPRVVLIGPPGAGKTTVGQLIARRLGLELLDTDALIVAREGRSIPDIFVDSGEPYFREIEREVVALALRDAQAVVALGGGAILDEGTRAELAGHTVVFLDVALRDASRRVGFDQGRPLLALNPRGQWLALMEYRRPLYQSLASLQIDTNGRTSQQVADDLVSRLRDIGHGSADEPSEVGEQSPVESGPA